MSLGNGKLETAGPVGKVGTVEERGWGKVGCGRCRGRLGGVGTDMISGFVSLVSWQFQWAAGRF